MSSDFSESLCSLPTDYLSEIILNIRHTTLENEDVLVKMLVAKHEWRQELWSKVIRRLAGFPNLRTLHLLGKLVVCPEFFCNITEYNGTPFQSLQELVLEFAMETADGRWFYKRDDKAFTRARNDPELKDFWEDHEDDNDHDLDSDSDSDFRVYEDGVGRTNIVYRDRFRSVPDPEVFKPFLQDASRAVFRAPKVRKFILKMTRASLCGDIPRDEVQSNWAIAAGPDAKIVFLDEDAWTSEHGGTGWHIYNGEI
ncbi:hypothetical protein N0V90_000136 [Kalmusia sp. IMI 367209]|nr:hypothetical protein N0V90_000136 [Kalmusia sp. IMI 367209]